jgi:UDP-glucose 4-epimerase
MVVPRFVRQALTGEPLTVYGDGTQRRCFCHVDDTVRALAGLMECEQSRGTIVNIGSDEEVTILDLATRVRRLVDSHSPITLVPYRRAYRDAFEDMPRRVPDTARIRDLIGWSPSKDLDEIVLDVIRHEREPSLGGKEPSGWPEDLADAEDLGQAERLEMLKFRER